MREFLSIDRAANAIRLRRSSFAGTFLLVEGGSDKIFYERFIDKLACQIVIASGKERVIGILDNLEKSNYLGMIGVVDADFDRLNQISYPSPNLFYTDTHDLETMLIKSPALDKVIAEFGSAEKVTEFGDVRIALINAGQSIGYLLWLSLSQQLNLKFEGIKFDKFIDSKTLKIDELNLIAEVRNKSQAFSLNSQEIQKQLIDQKDSNHDLWQVCRGHDLVEILSLGLRKIIGTNNSKDVEPESLERSLRLAYEQIYFCQTQLYINLNTWELKNAPFKVLSILSTHSI